MIENIFTGILLGLAAYVMYLYYLALRHDYRNIY